MTPRNFQPRTMKGTARSYADNPGKLWHALQPGQDEAICGTRPGKTSLGWDDFAGRSVTCPKCLKRLALLPRDPVDDPDFVFAALGRILAGEVRYARGGLVDMEQVIVRAAGAVAHEILTLREIAHPTPDQRGAAMEEAQDAVRRAMASQTRKEGKGDGDADSADTLPFCLHV